jgi:DNA (cytosine-5)-methyltransferase 1
MMDELVLSLFPGIGILDRGFEENGFCVVRGPDLLWGGDIKQFHPPAHIFEGIIGGPPCQMFSRLVYIVRHNGYQVQENLVPEFERVVAEAQPDWFVMENVIEAPLPCVDGYQVDGSVLDNRWLGGVQSRRHRFSFGTRDGRRLRYRETIFENGEWDYRVCASDYRRTPVKLLAEGKERGALHKYRKGSLATRGRARNLAESIRLQGLPEDFFDHAPWTAKAKGEAIGNAVALPMARELARSVREALIKKAAWRENAAEMEEVEE